MDDRSGEISQLPHSGSMVSAIAFGLLVPGWNSDTRLELPYRVLDNAPMAMTISSSAGELLWANRAWCSLAGLKPEELLEGTAAPDCDRAGADAEEHALAELFCGSSENVTYTQRWTHADGTERYVQLVASLEVALPTSTAPWPSPETVVVRQAIDITEQVRAERAASDARAQLELRNAALERSNAELDEFTYVISHDLSEPLRVISGHVQLLELEYGDALDADAREWIRFATDGCTRLRSLIEDLLEYSRVGRNDPTPTTVDLADVVDASEDQVGVALIESGGTVRRGALGQVIAVRSEMIQMTTNLLSNAIKFRRPDTRPVVEVSSTSNDGWTMLSVCDNGIGVPAEHRERVFGMFQRLHPRSAYSGTGVGLAVCRKVAQHHGGSVMIEDRAGGGTCVMVRLPAPPGEDVT